MDDTLAEAGSSAPKSFYDSFTVSTVSGNDDRRYDSALSDDGKPASSK